MLLCQVALVLAACGADDGEQAPPACLTDLDADCTASIPSTFDSVYTGIVQPSCGVSGGIPACHSAESKQSGLDLSTPARAYDGLLGKKDGDARVLPRDPDCSMLMQRLEADDDTFRMPLDTERLAPGLRCAVQQWIEAGAKR
jgi:Planctomycete cytochrome C